MKLWSLGEMWNGIKKSVKIICIVMFFFCMTISIEKHFRVNHPDSWFRPSNRLQVIANTSKWVCKGIGRRLAKIAAFVFGFFPAMEDVVNILWPLLELMTSIRHIIYGYIEYFMIISKEHYILSTIVSLLGFGLFLVFFRKRIWEQIKYWINCIFKKKTNID